MMRDRDYMRDPSGSTGRSLTITLIIILIALFVIQSCLEFYGGVDIGDWFALSLNGMKHGRVWQLLTFQFLHSTPWPWHVLFNCVGLYFFGRSVEETLGKTQFLCLYFASGFFGGLLSLATDLILPNHPDIPIVGASAGIMGLLAAYATLFPMREITFFVLFFPITLRAQYIFWFLFAISAFGTIIPFDGIAHAAHLGGLLMGVAYLKWGHKATEQFPVWRLFQATRRKKGGLPAPVATPVKPRRPKPAESADLPSGEFISQEVDPILDKISAHGIQSLTERERQILQAARSKMSRR